MGRFSGKVAAVTGGASGIGEATARLLAEEGAKVAIADLDVDRGRMVADEIRAKGTEAIFVETHTEREGEAIDFIRRACAEYGRLDVLVNNAGVLDDAPFLDLPVDELDRVLGVNLRGAFLMAQTAARQMVKQGRPAHGASAGAIVNMSSVNEKFGLPDHVAYSISKGGISQLTKAMAVALAPHGIRVNAVGPGTIDTPILEGVIKDKAFRAKVLSRTPLGRFGRPEEIAAIVAWLASEEASYVTGTTLFADGGRLPLNYVVPVAE
jgi:glucose 1-dehydrogenase